MLYYLFEYLENRYDLLGAGVFQYISFRAGMAAFVSLLIALVFGKKIIGFIQNKQIGESIRDLGLEGQMEKKGTPTMGGLMIILCIVIPTLLFAKITNIYIILLLISTIWLGFIGFMDDYIKVFKKNKEGLQGKFKIIGQVTLGLVVGLTLLYNSSVVVRQYILPDGSVSTIQSSAVYTDVESSLTTIPFLKNNELDYGSITCMVTDNCTPVLYVLLVIVVITAVSNGANITDGIDGLAAGTSAIIAATLSIFAYVSGNAIFASYLNIMYIPYSGELVIFGAALMGACIGFLWFNSYPAQIFMGDTGSLALGGVIAVMAIAVRKELLLPVICGIFVIENLSVIIQVSYFKYTKKKYGEGRRIFKMSPLHHHYQKSGFHESKIVTRFWIVGILLAILSLATLKLR
ncbi:phospho-N-acetylmuramoyl-pentapeptide-transferase [uncultured Cytophaga sp.]|uniref:phospho-N-acetylmuramoyl-pentapeptide- transferase n=1 Tax=uncultured Cytophaga sp. TaxID=160238 RepID=UPI00261603FA|nr:phospho-N-acetylmuramoyl-pentapeptide-transferase [uncultured Cytophaga sp.]